MISLNKIIFNFIIIYFCVINNILISMKLSDFGLVSINTPKTPKSGKDLATYLNLLPPDIRPEVLKRVANEDLSNKIYQNNNLCESELIMIINKFIDNLVNQIKDKSLVINYLENDLPKILSAEIYNSFRGQYKIKFSETAQDELIKSRKHFNSLKKDHINRRRKSLKDYFAINLLKEDKVEQNNKKSNSYRSLLNLKDSENKKSRRKSFKEGFASFNLFRENRPKELADEVGNTALIYTVKYDYVDIAKMLIVLKFSNVDSKNDKGNTPLIYAVKDNSIDMVKTLIERGADVNLENNNGNTALIYAVKNNNLEIAKMLLDNKASINHKNVYDYTALFYAVFFAYEDMVRLLLENDADPDVGALSEYRTLEIGSTESIYKLLNIYRYYNQK